MARSAANCSMGWCVGPSSPTPTESWVKTKQTFAFDRAANLIDGFM